MKSVLIIQSYVKGSIAEMENLDLMETVKKSDLEQVLSSVELFKCNSGVFDNM